MDFIYQNIMVADFDVWNVELIFNICPCLVLEDFLLYLEFTPLIMKTMIKNLFSEKIVKYSSCNVFKGTVKPPWTFESILTPKVSIRFSLQSSCNWSLQVCQNVPHYPPYIYVFIEIYSLVFDTYVCSVCHATIYWSTKRNVIMLKL